jgi:hypothetical protein
MPAFSFEKISPPAPPVPHTPAAATAIVRKHPGVIFQMLDRFVEARVRRAARENRTRPEPKRD